jgi:hypothetical protein
MAFSDDIAKVAEQVRKRAEAVSDDEAGFWLEASQTSLDAMWDNNEDDVYAQLLQT